MVEVKIYLTNDLDKRFRKAAMEAYGYARGSISKAASEAFLEWCRKREKPGEAAQSAPPVPEVTPEQAQAPPGKQAQPNATELDSAPDKQGSAQFSARPSP